MRRSIERTMELVRKEFRQLFRDRRMIAFMFGAPVLQLLLLGYAVSTDVRDTPMMVVDRDRTSVSRALIDAFSSSGRFVIVNGSNVNRALDRGDASVAMEIPAGFTRDLERGDASVQLLFDGTNSNQATVAKSYAERIAMSFGVARAGLTVRPPINLQSRAWFNPSLESRNYNVPGVTGVIVYFICLVLTAMAVVREREIGTLEQLMVSPLQPAELIAGKSIPVAIIGLFDVAIVSLLAVFYFGIPFRGSIVHLFAASLIYLLSGIGLGLLISTISKTQQEAFMATILVFMPSLLLSGFMFPIRSMPRFFQIVTLVNPVRHYMKIVRAIFLKGVGPSALWPEHVALLLIGSVVFVFAVSRFEKRLR
ncbi:MAG TPA: ABC transporter permease [Thermoanaerobaculia bacterium]|nr:ABC transporter permease [Thermoanaerobaculia bacterium]